MCRRGFPRSFDTNKDIVSSFVSPPASETWRDRYHYPIDGPGYTPVRTGSTTPEKSKKYPFLYTKTYAPHLPGKREKQYRMPTAVPTLDYSRRPCVATPSVDSSDEENDMVETVGRRPVIGHIRAPSPCIWPRGYINSGVPFSEL